MRKRNCDKLFDNIFWYTIYLFPIIISLLIVATNFSGDWFTTWIDYDGDFLNLPGIQVFKSVMWDFQSFPYFTFVYSAIVDFCEVVDVLNVHSFDDNALIFYLSYFISVYLLHLAVDVVLFIPRLCHKWMKQAEEGV